MKLTGFRRVTTAKPVDAIRLGEGFRQRKYEPRSGRTVESTVSPCGVCGEHDSVLRHARDLDARNVAARNFGNLDVFDAVKFVALLRVHE